MTYSPSCYRLALSVLQTRFRGSVQQVLARAYQVRAILLQESMHAFLHPREVPLMPRIGGAPSVSDWSTSFCTYRKFLWVSIATGVCCVSHTRRQSSKDMCAGTCSRATWLYPNVRFAGPYV